MNKAKDLHKIFDSRTRNAKTHTVTEEELAIAKKEAYEAGIMQGRAAANLEVIQRQELLQKELQYNLQLAVDNCLKKQADLQNQISQLILNVSIGLFKKVFPACSDKAGLDEVTAFIEAQLQPMNDLPELVISVHPEYVASIEDRYNIIKKKQDFHANIIIKALDDLEKTDCIISWGKGHIEKKLDNLIQSLTHIVTAPNSETFNKQDQ